MQAHADIGVIRRPPPIAMRLLNPVTDKLRDYAQENVKTRPLVVARPDAFRGQPVALCGAGPSLRDTEFADDIELIFACNSALPYLVDKGVPVTAGMAIDQTPLLIEEWADAPDVLYILASTVDPELVKMLKGHDREVVFFHNLTGFGESVEEEYQYYCDYWPPTLLVGSGQTVVGRMVSVLNWMGAGRIDVHGADCALGKDDIAHANGQSAEDAYTGPAIFTGTIDGRQWRTRVDMLHEAVILARMARTSDGVLRLVGDTLPNALLDKPDEFLNLVCRQLGPDELDELPPDPMDDPAARALIEQWS